VGVSLDYLSRRYRRGVEIIGADATARLDWARNVLEVEDERGVESNPADTPVAVSYRKQAEHFLRFLNGDAAAPVDAAEGARSVRLAAAIRDAAR
jgi:predicted dehydrogenase